MIMERKIKIRISIAAKGKGNIANIEREYTMEEHFNDSYIKDGQDYAQSKFGLNKDDVVVQDWPAIDKLLESEIDRLYGGEGKVAVPKVHNPMHSCFKSYRLISTIGRMVLIKPVSAGIVYAIPNDNWIAEFKAA